MRNTKQYQFAYKHIEPKAIEYVKQIIEAGFFKQENDEKLKWINELHKGLCSIYDLPVVEIIYQATPWNNGCFDVFEQKIYLFGKISLVTYLHEFKHFMQMTRLEKNSEEIARGWSLSLFYNASPKHFEMAVDKGQILHQNVVTDDKEKQDGDTNI